MKLMRSKDIMVVAITDIVEPNWDIRSTPEDEAGIIALSNSIKKDGFINPITCIRFGEKYKVIAGRRRLKAAKLIGLKEIPIYVKDDATAELDHRRIALIENCHRKDMQQSERAHGFIAVYEMAGYTKEQVIGGVKSIDNWFSQDKNRTWEQFATEIISVPNPKAHGTNELRNDPKFVEICKDIGFTPKYQYQLMQIIVQLKPEIVKKAEQAKLSTEQKILLTTRPLRDHPKIQENLIKEIEHDLPKKRVHERIQQVAKDLETGYLTQNDRGAYYYNTGGPRELIKDADKILEPLNIAHLDITDAVNTFLHRMTNHKLTKGEFHYTDKHLEATKTYRIEVVKASEDRALISMEQQMKHIKSVTQELLRLIDQELETRTMKEKMSSK